MTSGPPLCGLRHWSIFKELLVSLVVQSRAQLGTLGRPPAHLEHDREKLHFQLLNLKSAMGGSFRLSI